MNLMNAVQAWGAPDFKDRLKAEIQSLGVDSLPLFQAMRHGNQVLEDPAPTVMINGVDEHEDSLEARVGVFFSAIHTGGCCADDPTVVEPHQEYAELTFKIDRATGDCRVDLTDF